MQNQIQQPQLGEYLKETDSCKKNCSLVGFWILTLLIWAGIISSIIISNNSVRVSLIVITIFLYIIYLIFELISDTRKVISNIKSPEQIYDILDQIIKNPVKIIFEYEIYEKIYEKDNEGNDDIRYVYKDSETDIINIYSTRDISGTFNFYSGNNSYLLLELDSQINFADTLSYNDYEKEKNYFKERKVSLGINESKTFKERIEIEGMNQNTYF